MAVQLLSKSTTSNLFLLRSASSSIHFKSLSPLFTNKDRMFSSAFSRFSTRQTSKVVGKQFKSTSKVEGSILEADGSNSLNKYYHKSHLLLAVLTPAAFLVPAGYVQPIDVALGLILPFHAHVGLNYVISDYVPKGSRGLVRGVLLAATLIGTAGLLKLNLTGPGLTSTVLRLWRKPEEKK